MFSKNQTEEMSQEAKEIVTLIKNTHSILYENNNINDTDNKNNIIYVDFQLKNEFKAAEKYKFKLPQLLSIYHDWAFRTNKLAEKNISNLSNKKIKNLIEENNKLVLSIIDVVNQNNK